MTKARDLANSANGASIIADDAVDADAIAANAVITAGILNANVTTAKIADANVTQGKLADQSVNEAKMQVSNAPVNGYVLSAQSGNTGGMTWAEAASGHWSNIAEVALGASNVAAIQITLPAGYDLHRLDIRFPRPTGSATKALFMEVPRDGSSQSSFSYNTTSLLGASHEGANSRDEDTFTMSPVGGAAVGDNLFYSITFSDWRSSSRLSSWSGRGHQWIQSEGGMWQIRTCGFDYGSADDTSSFEVHTGVNFTLTGGVNFKTMTGCYYRLYGHNYS